MTEGIMQGFQENHRKIVTLMYYTYCVTYKNIKYKSWFRLWIRLRSGINGTCLRDLPINCISRRNIQHTGISIIRDIPHDHPLANGRSLVNIRWKKGLNNDKDFIVRSMQQDLYVAVFSIERLSILHNFEE